MVANPVLQYSVGLSWMLLPDYTHNIQYGSTMPCAVCYPTPQPLQIVQVWVTPLNKECPDTPCPAGVASQMQHQSGPDKARKSTEPQPGVKRKRSAEPQPPSGASEGYPSTDDGSEKGKKRKAVEVHHLHLKCSRAEHAGHDCASKMQFDISDMSKCLCCYSNFASGGCQV